METLIVGAGEMGRWFGRLVGDPTFADRDPAAAERAADALDGADTLAVEEEGTFELVCIAVPIPAATEAIAAHGGRAERAIVDVTGVMEPVVAAMAAAAPDVERASLHPLFSADAAPGNVAVAVEESGPVTAWLRDRLREEGNELVPVEPAEHDDAMTTVQGRAHAAVLAFALAADDVPEGLETPVYEDLRELVDRITGNTPRVYADIQDAFDGASDVAEMAQALADADHTGFEALYEDAGR